MLSDGKRVIHLDSEIPDRTFHFPVTKQKLHRTQVACATVDQGSRQMRHLAGQDGLQQDLADIPRALSAMTRWDNQHSPIGETSQAAAAKRVNVGSRKKMCTTVAYNFRKFGLPLASTC